MISSPCTTTKKRMAFPKSLAAHGGIGGKFSDNSLSQTGVMPFLASATELVRRFLPPETSDQDAICAAISLMGQCSVFVRSREQLAQPPFNLNIDEAFAAILPLHLA